MSELPQFMTNVDGSLSAPTNSLEVLRGLHSYLEQRIIGQPEVLPSLVELIQNGELGLTDPRRPRASFLFLGPTGVGKTEVTLNFSDYIFGEDRVARFDMSEYQLQSSVEKIIGASRDDGGLFEMEYDRIGGEGTILFDEIEKGHPRVIDLFLQILDAGRITLASGRTLDLSKTYVVATSNIGAQALMSQRRTTRATLVRFVESQAQLELRPEIFARMDQVCVFNRLTYDDQRKIAQIMIQGEIGRQAKQNGLKLEYSSELVQICMSQGFHPKLGARPMRGAVERNIRAAIRENLLAGGSGSGHLVSYTDEGVVRLESKARSPENGATPSTSSGQTPNGTNYDVAPPVVPLPPVHRQI